MERQGQICQMIAPAVRQQIWGPVPIHPHHAHGGTPALRIWQFWRQMLVCSTINYDKQTQPEPQSMLSCVHYTNIYKLYHALALLQLLLQFSAGIFHTCAIRRSFPRRHRPCKWNLHSDVCRCRREPMQCATQHLKSKWAV
jgi:hypothetical protein